MSTHSTSRKIMGLADGDKRVVDHINGNRSDNRECNLRICTRSQNNANQRPHKHSSEYKGVSWYSRYGRWQAKIKVNAKARHLGYFRLEELAALAYDMAAVRHFGAFARLNFN